MAVLVKNESGQDYRFAGHSNEKLIVAGATVLVSDAEWDSVITGKRGAGQLSPQPLPVDASVVIPPVTVDPAPPYALALELDDVGGSPYLTYVGEADPGTAPSAAAWRIKKLAETGPDVAVTWASGASTFTQIWDDRASLSYA